MLLASCCLLSCMAQLAVPAGHLATCWIHRPALRCPLKMGWLPILKEVGKGLRALHRTSRQVMLCSCLSSPFNPYAALPAEWHFPAWLCMPDAVTGHRGYILSLLIPHLPLQSPSGQMPQGTPALPARCPPAPRLPCWARPQHRGRRWHRCRGEH